VPDNPVIMGVDAALYATGVGIIEVDDDDNHLIHVELIKTSQRQKLPSRLEKLYDTICSIIDRFNPDILALEDIFYSKNLKIALSLGQARGAVMLACAHHKVELAEFSAREIKQAVTGNGGASKEQVAYMVKSILNYSGEFETLDISDSLAAALCAGFKLNQIV